MNLPAEAVNALHTFQAAAGWEHRARLLMQWGDRLPPLSEADKSETHRARLQVACRWASCTTATGSLPRAAMRLIRGLVALLLARVNGLSAQDLQQVDLPDWFNQLGLSRQLSPSRSNGLNVVLQRMNELAIALPF